MADQMTLLERHRPLLKYDAQDPYRACSALTIIENPGNKLVDKRGGLLAPIVEAAKELLLDTLGVGDDRRGERLDEGGNEQKILKDALRMQRRQQYADRTYWRFHQDGETVYLQYWFWLYYNPKDVLGRGRHEGDWEMIQVRLENERPVCAVYAQHAHATRASWDQVETHEDDEGVHPVVYVAAESHASYFEEGTHPAFGRADNAYGDGPKIKPELVEFGPWADWPGRWGNSTGILSWLPAFLWDPPAGKSPEGPGQQKTKWLDPKKFEEDARAHKPKRQRRLWQLGKRSVPPKPEIVEARLEGDRAFVRYRTRSVPLRRRSKHLLITVSDDGEVIGREAVKDVSQEGEVQIPLVRAPDRAEVLLSGFNRRRQRSEVDRQAVTQG